MTITAQDPKAAAAAERARKWGLEPSAMDQEYDWGDTDPTDDETRRSMAISLKRIADRLEAITTIIDGGGGEADQGQLNVGANCDVRHL